MHIWRVHAKQPQNACTAFPFLGICNNCYRLLAFLLATEWKGGNEFPRQRKDTEQAKYHLDEIEVRNRVRKRKVETIGLMRALP